VSLLRTAALRTYALAGALAVVAALICVQAPSAALVTRVGPRWVIDACLAVGFIIGEQLLMNLEFRKQAHSITLAGIPLALGVMIAPIGDVVAARVVGAALALILQRIAWEKIAYNCASWAFEAAVDCAVLHLVIGSRSDLDLRRALAVTCVVVLCDQVMSVLVLAVIRMHGGVLSAAEIADVLGLSALFAAVTSTAAIAVMLLSAQGPLGVATVVLFTVVTLVVYRSYLQTTRRHQRLEVMHDFVTVGNGGDTLTGVAQDLLSRIRSTLRAARAELCIIDETSAGRPVLRIVDDEEAGFFVMEERPELDWASIRALRDGEPFLAPRSAKDRAVRRWLADHGHRDAMVVPLPSSTGLTGTVRVVDRLGEFATFTEDDLTLLQTLTGHLTVAAGNARLVEQLGYEATHDALTGLGNRAQLSRRIEHQLRQASGACVILLDLDRFKEVNDGLGHVAGDRLLCAVAERLRSFFTPDATVARLGGDEFAVLVPGEAMDAAAAGDLGERLAAELAQPVHLEEAVVTPDASIGIALGGRRRVGLDRDGTDVDLLRQADTAMYAAKESDTTVAVYQPEMDSGRVEKLALIADLRIALRQAPQQLAVYFQPKLDLRTGKIVSAEALVRWNHPQLGVLNPDRFLHLAESTGLMDQFTPLVLDAALKECRRWWQKGSRVTVAVNLSARNVCDPALPDLVATALAKVALPPTCLILEITESSLVADPAQALQVLDRIAGTGVTISLDDFGTGYSSLSYLQRLPAQEVKIDRSFVVGLTSANPQSSRALIASITGLADHFNLRVVAEGVEDDDVMHELRDLGCDVAQGYYIGKPMPAGDSDRWLRYPDLESFRATKYVPPSSELRLVEASC
jgi:diguanylate cyclase (GGDEF)-like protein